MRKAADYQGYSNWETWNTSLMLDNDYDTYKKSRELFEKGMTVEQLQDFLLRKVIGPYNKERIEEAKEWNSIPKDERIDYHYEDLKNKSPEAADFVDALGFGKDVEDSEPELIDPDLVNYQEIWDHLYDEIEGNNEYDRQMKDLQSQGLSWTTNHDLMTNQMRDAFYRYHGAIPEEELEAMPGSQWDNPGAYHNINVTTPWEQLSPDVMEGNLLNHIDRETRMKIWERQNELYPNMSHYEREHVIDWEQDPVVQQLIENDPNIQKLKQEGYTQRLHDLTWQTINAIHRGKPTPYADVMRQALEQRGYTPEQIQEMFKPQWRWQPNPQYRDPNAPYDQRTNPGDWINLSPKMDQAQIDKSLDQPGDMTLPEHWGNVSDPWDAMFADQGNDWSDPDATQHRRPFIIDFEDIDNPDPPIWIGEPGQYHDESPLYNVERPYYGEIWEHTDPPVIQRSWGTDDVYDPIAKAQAERHYYQQQGLKKRSSDGADYWTQSQDDWWGTQNDSLFNVNTPGEAPGMPHNMDTGADPNLFKNPCWCDVGPTDPHEWTGACENGKRPTMEHEAADHWRDEPRDETGKWTRHPDSLKPVKGKHHRLKVHDHKNHEHHIVRCWECGLPMDVYKGEVNRCHHCGARRPFEDDLLDSLKDSRTAAFNHDRFLRENGFEQFGTHEHAKAYRWTDPQGIEHRLGVSRNPNNQKYVPQDVADCQAGKCRCADALWQPAQAETVVEPDAPIHSNSLVGWGGETWTVGEIANDIAEIFNTQTGESEIVPVRDLALAKTADMVPSGQVHVMPEEGRDEWGEGQWDTDTFLDHRMLNKSLREQQQAQEYLDFMKRHKRAEDAEWPSIGMKEAADSPSYSDDPEAWMADREAWYAQEPRDCPRCGRGPTVYGSDLHGEKQEWCPSCGWTDRDEVKQQAVPKPGDLAYSRDGHPVQIIRLYTQDENLFALVRYLDGYMPYPSVGGRAGGSEEDPLWEHRVYDGKVVKPGGDYYNPNDWKIEKGLRLADQDQLPGLFTSKTAADNVPGMPVSDSGHWVWLDGKVGFGGAHHEIAEKLADELGYGKDDKAYVSNWLARGHCPQDRAVAVGTFKNNRPYIWNSTRDRNHIWDAVMQAREATQTAT